MAVLPRHGQGGDFIMKNREELEQIAKKMRLNIVKMTYSSGIKGAHLGGSMSIVEILAVLYGNVMKYDVVNYDADERDRLIISKAHGAIALYAALYEAGFLSAEDIDCAMHGESQFFEHPKMSLKHGIEFSGGSLGQGLSLGMGMALGLAKKNNIHSKVYVILGDGECDEGQVWEAASAIIHYKLKNLTVIIDANGLQYDGKNASIMNLGNLESRWSSLGYQVEVINGHDVDEVQNALFQESDIPKAIIAKTVKGKGVKFAENVVSWHTGRLTDELYQEAIRDIND